MNKLVLDMKDKRPVWARPDWFVPHLRDAIPDDWEIVVIEEDADGSGDGSARASAAVLEAVKDARVYMGFGIAAEVVTEGWDLEWVHTGAAGVGKSLTPEMLASPVRFTNSAGIHAVPMAETVLGMILYFARVSTSRSPVWPREDGLRIRTTKRTRPCESCRRASSGSSGLGESGGRSP